MCFDRSDFFCRRRAVVYYFLQSTKQRGLRQRYWAMGFRVKTVLSIIIVKYRLKVLPDIFLLVGF